MSNIVQHKYPLQSYNGKLIRGHAEIDENGDLQFSIWLSMCAPKSASKRFRNNMSRYHEYVSNYVFSEASLRDKLYPYLSQAKRQGYLFKGMTWKRDDGIQAIQEFERIVESVGMVFTFDIESKYVTRYASPSSHDSFILSMLKSLDAVMNNIQQQNNNVIMFVPLHLSRVRSERKITMLNLQAETKGLILR